MQLQSLESRLNDLAPRPPAVEAEGSRVAALEMELNLVRSRFARETLLSGPWCLWAFGRLAMAGLRRQQAEKQVQEAQLKQSGGRCVTY